MEIEEGDWILKGGLIGKGFNLIDNPKNYEEDFSHENGNYLCHCCECKEHFLGHKRRVICKVCLNKEENGKDTEN